MCRLHKIQIKTAAAAAVVLATACVQWRLHGGQQVCRAALTVKPHVVACLKLLGKDQVCLHTER